MMDRAAGPYGEKDEACGNGKRLAMPWRCRSPLQPGKKFPCWSIINRTNERQSHWTQLTTALWKTSSIGFSHEVFAGEASLESW